MEAKKINRSRKWAYCQSYTEARVIALAKGIQVQHGCVR